jgi:hypothetical protein
MLIMSTLLFRDKILLVGLLIYLFTFPALRNYITLGRTGDDATNAAHNLYRKFFGLEETDVLPAVTMGRVDNAIVLILKVNFT